jgi:hypothetical protein
MFYIYNRLLLLIVDQGNHRVQSFRLRNDNDTMEVVHIFGTSGIGDGQFYQPTINLLLTMASHT